MSKTKVEMLHLGLAIFWMIMIVPAILFWKESILLVIMMSLYANIEASFAAFLAAESKPDKEKPRLRTTNISHGRKEVAHASRTQASRSRGQRIAR